jgi:hypothetical protein
VRNGVGETRGKLQVPLIPSLAFLPGALLLAAAPPFARHVLGQPIDQKGQDRVLGMCLREFLRLTICASITLGFYLSFYLSFSMWFRTLFAWARVIAMERIHVFRVRVR